MLICVQEQLCRGVDLVVGLVEIYGCIDIQVLLEGLLQLLLKDVVYYGYVLQEMDLDVVLVWYFVLVLVDELVYCNVLGSCYEWCWQDVMELLDVGIDVWIMVNIQYLESFNDVVMWIIGVCVSEIVFDGVFDCLYDIVLVDLLLCELIVCLQQGKVYVFEQVVQVLQVFFLLVNLIVLCELVMQEVVDCVDSSLCEICVVCGESNLFLCCGVLVVIDGGGQSEYLVCVVWCIVECCDVLWMVVIVQGWCQDEVIWCEIDVVFVLVWWLGGDVELLYGLSIVDVLFDYVVYNGVLILVLGWICEWLLVWMFNCILIQQLIQCGVYYEIIIISMLQVCVCLCCESLLLLMCGISYELV